MEAGMASKDLLLQMEAQLADDELKITETRGNVDIALIELARLMNITEHIHQFDIVVDTTRMELSDCLNKGDLQINHFPQIRSAQHRLQSAQWALKKAKAGYFPSLSLGGSIGSSNYIQSEILNSPLFEQLKNNRQAYVYVALRIPLFDKFVTRDNLRGIKIDIRNQSLVLQETENNLRAEALKMESEILNARQKLWAANQSVSSYTEAFRFVTEKFDAGKLSVYEHLQVKQRLANSQSQAVQAKYDLAYKIMLHEYYYSNKK
jgi:outer membrane protein